MAEVCNLVAVSREEILGRLSRPRGIVDCQIWHQDISKHICPIVGVGRESLDVNLPAALMTKSANDLICVLVYRQNQYLFRFRIEEEHTSGPTSIRIPDEVWRVEQRQKERLLLFPFITAYLLLPDVISNGDKSSNILHFDRRKMFEDKMLGQLHTLHLSSILNGEQAEDFRFFRLIDLTANSFSFIANQDEINLVEKLLALNHQREGKLVIERQSIAVAQISILYHVPMMVADFPGGKFLKIGCQYELSSAFDFQGKFGEKLTEKLVKTTDSFLKAVVDELSKIRPK